MNKLTTHRNNFSPVSKLMDDFFNDSIFDVVPSRRSSGKYSTSADIIDAEDSYQVRMDVPGVNREDVNVEVTNDDQLIISADRSDTNEETDNTYIRYSKKQQTYSFTVSLGSTVDTEDITANLENGVLTVDLPKTDGNQPVTKKIQVN